MITKVKISSGILSLAYLEQSSIHFFSPAHCNNKQAPSVKEETPGKEPGPPLYYAGSTLLPQFSARKCCFTSSVLDLSPE